MHFNYIYCSGVAMEGKGDYVSPKEKFPLTLTAIAMNI